MYDTREVLIQDALRVFGRAGIAAATLDGIAAEAGVPRGTLTSHFHSKDDLLAGIIKHFGPHSVVRPVVEQIERDLKNGVPLDDETIFRRIAGAFYDGFTAQGDQARLAILLVYTHPDVARLLVEKFVKGRKIIVEYIHKRQEEGDFCKHISPDLCVQVIATYFAIRAW